MSLKYDFKTKSIFNPFVSLGLQGITFKTLNNTIDNCIYANKSLDEYENDKICNNISNISSNLVYDLFTDILKNSTDN